jgi:hypothetical protein
MILPPPWALSSRDFNKILDRFGFFLHNMLNNHKVIYGQPFSIGYAMHYQALSLEQSLDT